MVDISLYIYGLLGVMVRRFIYWLLGFMVDISMVNGIWIPVNDGNAGNICYRSCHGRKSMMVPDSRRMLFPSADFRVFWSVVPENRWTSIILSYPDAPCMEYLPTFTPKKGPRFVGKYSSTMEHLGMRHCGVRGVISAWETRQRNAWASLPWRKPTGRVMTRIIWIVIERSHQDMGISSEKNRVDNPFPLLLTTPLIINTWGSF